MLIPLRDLKFCEKQGVVQSSRDLADAASHGFHNLIIFIRGRHGISVLLCIGSHQVIRRHFLSRLHERPSDMIRSGFYIQCSAVIALPIISGKRPQHVCKSRQILSGDIRRVLFDRCSSRRACAHLPRRPFSISVLSLIGDQTIDIFHSLFNIRFLSRHILRDHCLPAALGQLCVLRRSQHSGELFFQSTACRLLRNFIFYGKVLFVFIFFSALQYFITCKGISLLPVINRFSYNGIQIRGVHAQLRQRGLCPALPVQLQHNNAV